MRSAQGHSLRHALHAFWCWISSPRGAEGCFGTTADANTASTGCLGCMITNGGGLVDACLGCANNAKFPTTAEKQVSHVTGSQRLPLTTLLLPTALPCIKQRLRRIAIMCAGLLCLCHGAQVHQLCVQVSDERTGPPVVTKAATPAAKVEV